MKRLDIVLVHYRTPELAAEAVRVARRELAAARLGGDVIIVENGNDASGRRLLGSLPVTYVEAGENLGYAGGVNLGVSRTTAEWVLVMNPDVILLPGCLAVLARALEDGCAAVGPRFYWDRTRRMLLPPPEPRSHWDELASVFARRGGAFARLARRQFRRHARRHWQARGPLPSESLSGSLLAFHRAVWERVGPFDSAFRLYFEETEWLRRVVAAGFRPIYVPAAEAVHLFGRSARHEPQASTWFEASARRFRVGRYGALFNRALEALARRLPTPEIRGNGSARRVLALPTQAAGLWVEVSPNPAGFPAAAERLEGGDAEWRLPAEVEAGMTGAIWTAQICDDRGRELARYRLQLGAGAASSQL